MGLLPVFEPVLTCWLLQSLSALRYGGATGGNNSTLRIVESATRDSVGLFGTSFSTPIVAGAASLHGLQSQSMVTNLEALDARVIRASLVNSADKLRAGMPLQR